MAVCKRCGAKIDWEYTENGKPMPVNLGEVWITPGAGNTTILDDKGRVVKGTSTGYPTAQGISGHVPHWATCAGERTAKGKKVPDAEGQVSLF